MKANNDSSHVIWFPDCNLFAIEVESTLNRCTKTSFFHHAKRFSLDEIKEVFSRSNIRSGAQAIYTEFITFYPERRVKDERKESQTAEETGTIPDCWQQVG